jgi:cell division septation protein DedD
MHAFVQHSGPAAHAAPPGLQLCAGPWHFFPLPMSSQLRTPPVPQQSVSALHDSPAALQLGPPSDDPSFELPSSPPPSVVELPSFVVEPSSPPSGCASPVESLPHPTNTAQPTATTAKAESTKGIVRMPITLSALPRPTTARAKNR